MTNTTTLDWMKSNDEEYEHIKIELATEKNVFIGCLDLPLNRQSTQEEEAVYSSNCRV